MQITNVTAKNYRTLHDFEINFANGYCAISGRNNCGKSTVLKVIEYFLKGKDQNSYFYRDDNSIKFDRDKTLWSDPDSIDISITIKLSLESDSEIFSFIGKFSEDVGDKSQIDLKVRAVSVPDMEISHSSYVDGVPQDAKATIEIIKKLKSSKSLILHNSTLNRSNFFYMDDSYV